MHFSIKNVKERYLAIYNVIIDFLYIFFYKAFSPCAPIAAFS
jgi:hypothetical protein